MTSVNTKGAQRDDDLDDHDERTISPPLDDAEGQGDLNMYFEDKKSLLEHLANLEEENLFKIHLVQEDEQALENTRKEVEENIALREREIQDVRRNIEMLEHSRGILFGKQ